MFPHCFPTDLSVPHTGWALFWLRAFDFAVTCILEVFSWNLGLTGFFSASKFQLNAASSGKPFWNAHNQSHFPHPIWYPFIPDPGLFLSMVLIYAKCSCLFMSPTQLFFFLNFFSPPAECKLHEGRNDLVHCCIHRGWNGTRHMAGFQ